MSDSFRFSDHLDPFAPAAEQVSGADLVNVGHDVRAASGSAADENARSAWSCSGQGVRSFLALETVTQQANPDFSLQSEQTNSNL